MSVFKSLLALGKLPENDGQSAIEKAIPKITDEFDGTSSVGKHSKIKMQAEFDFRYGSAYLLSR